MEGTQKNKCFLVVERLFFVSVFFYLLLPRGGGGGAFRHPQL